MSPLRSARLLARQARSTARRTETHRNIGLALGGDSWLNQAEILIHAVKHYYLKRGSWKSHFLVGKYR